MSGPGFLRRLHWFDKLDVLVDEILDGVRDGEESNFTIFEHGRLLMLYGTSGSTATTESDVDYRTEYYLHNTAAGKAILAELDRDRAERILDKWGMPR